MAKSGIFSGGGAMRQPSPQRQMGQAQAGRQVPGTVPMFSRGPGGILPERGSKEQYDLVKELLASGLASAKESGSPLLAFLAPLVGGAVSARTAGLREAAKGADSGSSGGGSRRSSSGGSSGSRRSRSGRGGMAPGGVMQRGGDVDATPAAVRDRIVRNMALEEGGGPTVEAAETLDAARQIEAASGGNDVAQGIIETAASLQMDPVDLATIISYETAGTFDPAKAGPTTQWGQHRGLIQFGEPQAKRYGVNWEDPIGSQLGPDGAVARYFRDNGWQPGMSMLDAYSIVNAGGPGLYNRSDANNGGAPGTVRDKVENQMAGHRAKAERLLAGASTPRDAMAAQDRYDMARAAVSLEDALAPVDPQRMQAAMPEPASEPVDPGMARAQNEAARILQSALDDTPGETRAERIATLARSPMYRAQMRILGIEPDELLDRLASEGEAGTQTAAASPPASDLPDPLGIR